MGVLIRSGELDQRVQLQSCTTVENLAGEPTRVYSNAGTPIAAKVIGQKGEESFVAARTESSRTIKVKLRRRDDVTTESGLVWNGDFYDVRDVDQSKARQGETWLMCVARKIT